MHSKLGIAVSLLLVSVAPRAVPAQSADAAAIRRVLEAYAELLQAKDVAGMDTLIAHDEWVHIIEGAGVNHGWRDYREHHLKPELAESENVRYRYFAIEPQVRGSTAWTPLRYELSVDMRGQHIAVEGRGTAVLENRSGRWVIVHLHTSGRRKEQGG